jgi:hypothetical protein
MLLEDHAGTTAMDLQRLSVPQIAEPASIDAAAMRFVHQVQAAEQSRFASPGRAKQDSELALLKSEGSRVKRDKIAEPYRDIFKLNHGFSVYFNSQSRCTGDYEIKL